MPAANQQPDPSDLMHRSGELFEFLSSTPGGFRRRADDLAREYGLSRHIVERVLEAARPKRPQRVLAGWRLVAVGFAFLSNLYRVLCEAPYWTISVPLLLALIVKLVVGHTDVYYQGLHSLLIALALMSCALDLCMYCRNKRSRQ